MHLSSDQLLYRPEEAARVLGIGRSRLFTLLKGGELTSVQIGRSRRIPRESLEGYVTRLVGPSRPAA